MEFGKHWMFSLKPKAIATEYRDRESMQQCLNSNETLYHEKKMPQISYKYQTFSFNYIQFVSN